ncbi:MULTISPECIES: ATP-binding cassette domain-containing protein [unclassified Paenibacillus]|uniref:ATP-binding cassette domain-containing protein n=1 Tax=unclassified Paenibacillus TaxID=185978 RepID=UPI001C0F73F9|nr:MULTISPECIES: ATP-binding cassette domain-containing protein [unclassified Paenibacillus]MBU5444730.1 ATP-binding cassette domain-containing protein [Paenibacillus sp. MSJ-34]CAH0121088.1 Energy-coupling factor transporter ATP-binding protein EcfA2 [Paenibacillus sp. CECT 9249]
MDIVVENVNCMLAARTPFYQKVIDRISLHIPAGQFVAMMGPTGSGKTTLGQMIGGLIPSHSGVIRIGPYRVNKKTDRRRLWKAIGFLFQFPEHQVLEDTVFTHIGAGLHRLGMRREWVSEQVKQAMEAVGLCYSQFKDLSPFQISGGELRRIALAGVLVAEPEILILDEPTAGLDSRERSRMLSYIKRIHDENKMTVIYITHRLEEALEYADRILVLDHGRLYADFHPCKIRDHWPRLERIGFVKTPLLRFIDALEKRAAEPLPESLYKEEQLMSFIANLSREDL